MNGVLFIAAAVLYWVCFAGRIYLWDRDLTSVENWLAALEKIGLLVFTAALVIYIGKLRVVGGQLHSEYFDRPLSLLLFAWAMSAANLVTEILYLNRSTAVFSNFWCAFTLSLSSATAATFRVLFSADLGWLSFHRLCFLLGYAFCILAIPLACRFLWTNGRMKWVDLAAKKEGSRSLNLWDRLTFRLVLLALPLLTAGIITEALVLMENHRLPTPIQIWSEDTETFLALAAWFLCGVFLHTRLFYGWKNLKSASLYLAGAALLLAAHIAQGLHRLG